MQAVNTDYDQMCAICLDKWSRGGEHMATQLKCGHIFGYSCIRRWVTFAHNCPICKCFSQKRHMKGVFHNLLEAGQSSLDQDRKLERKRMAKARRRAIRARRAMTQASFHGDVEADIALQDTMEHAETEV